MAEEKRRTYGDYRAETAKKKKAPAKRASTRKKKAADGGDS